jgi:hypothetical protein
MPMSEQLEALKRKAFYRALYWGGAWSVYRLSEGDLILSDKPLKDAKEIYRVGRRP